MKRKILKKKKKLKEVFLEISENSQENTCARDSFLIKLQAVQLLYRTPPNGCFCMCHTKLRFLVITILVLTRKKSVLFSSKSNISYTTLL